MKNDRAFRQAQYAWDNAVPDDYWDEDIPLSEDEEENTQVRCSFANECEYAAECYHATLHEYQAECDVICWDYLAQHKEKSTLCKCEPQ